MSLARTTAWTLLVAAGFALFVRPASAQPADLPKKPDTAKIIEWRDTPRGGIPKGEELKTAREKFANLAKYFADVVAHPAVWKASLDPKFDPNSLLIPTLDHGNNGILRELDRFLIVPTPGKTGLNLEPADYIRELGAALDAALKNLIETHPEMIVRINATRVLAHVARTGAPAHFPTVTALIANANTPTGIKNYLFEAAAGLLAAYDPNDIRVRKHAADPKTIGALVKAIDDCINTPALLYPGVADKPENMTADQLAVIGYVRRQAVRALAQVKFVTVTGPDGKPLYPAYTLVRVAMSDPALAPAPGPAEAAEAAIGLCNMAPVAEQLKGGFKPVREYNSDVAVEAITTAMVNFVGPRAARAEDRTLPWRSYAIRIGEAMRNWRPLFDPDFDITQPNKFDAKLVPAQVESLYTELVPKVLAPMDKVDFSGKPDIGARVDLPWLQKRVTDLKARPKRNTELFAGVKATSINFPPPAPPAPAPAPPPPPKK